MILGWWIVESWKNSAQKTLIALMKKKNGRDSNLKYAARKRIRNLRNTKDLVVREADK